MIEAPYTNSKIKPPAYTKEQIQKLDEVRELVNFEVIKNIFVKLVKKSFDAQTFEKEGDVKELQKFLEKSFYSALPDNLDFMSLTTAGLSIQKNREQEIRISNRNIERKAKFKIFRVLLHELCHGVSKFYGKGLHRHKLFEPLDEALTEDLGNYIFREYMKRTGENNLWESDNLSVFTSEKEIGVSSSYSRFRKQLWDYIKNLSIELEIPEDVIYKAWIGHYLRGDFNLWFKDFIKESETDPRKIIFNTRKDTIDYYANLLFTKFKSILLDEQKELGAKSVNLL